MRGQRRTETWGPEADGKLGAPVPICLRCQTLGKRNQRVGSRGQDGERLEMALYLLGLSLGNGRIGARSWTLRKARGLVFGRICANVLYTFSSNQQQPHAVSPMTLTSPKGKPLSWGTQSRPADREAHFSRLFALQGLPCPLPRAPGWGAHWPGEDPGEHRCSEDVSSGSSLHR